MNTNLVLSQYIMYIFYLKKNIEFLCLIIDTFVFFLFHSKWFLYITFWQSFSVEIFTKIITRIRHFRNQIKSLE